MIELCHLDVRHYVILKSVAIWRTVAQPNVVASVSCYFANYHMSVRNNMRYTYFRICFGICVPTPMLNEAMIQLILVLAKSMRITNT